MKPSPPFLEMRDISMTFPGVRALDHVSFALERGEVHAIVGENGAGKSTLIKILCGAYPYPRYEGEILIDGHACRFTGVSDSARAGVAAIFQELSLVDELSAAENILLGREPSRIGVINWDLLYGGAAELLASLKADINARTPVRELGIGQQQLVEIAKALSQHARILVLDEPTAALADREAELLFSVLRNLREQGAGIIYISHKLDEVFTISDRITVLRDGRTVGTKSTAAITEREVIAMMVGREVGEMFQISRREPAGVALEVREFCVESADVKGKLVVDGVSFSVRSGEVLGVAGLMGAGRSDLLMGIFGACGHRARGEILLNGQRARIHSPADAIALGIGFVTEDRKRFGLVLDQSVLKNMTLAALDRVSGRFLTDAFAEAEHCEGLARDLRIKTPSVFTETATLSGGNQQKVVLAKWLLTNPRVLLLDEPTRGIDVGAKQEIYAEIDRLARSGIAVVLVSSDLQELLGVSDRLIVLHEGRVTGEFTRAAAKPEAVMACATGQSVSHADSV